MYLYRAVDKAGQTVDFFLSRKRDVTAAKSLLRSALKNTRVPTKITLDGFQEGLTLESHHACRFADRVRRLQSVLFWLE